MVGGSSSLFSSMYLSSTSIYSSTSEGATVTRLGLDVVGGLSGSLIPEGYESPRLPIWRFRQATP